MNYSKKEVEVKRKKLRKKKSRGRRAHLYTLFKIFTVTLLIVVALILAGVAGYAGRLLSDLPDINQVDVSPNGFQTHILDINGDEIETLAGMGANREYVTLDQIPIDLQHAFVAIEDNRFYSHNGIDPVGIARAGFAGVAKLIKGGSPNQGASTITQQLLKNNYFSGWTSEKSFQDRLERKIKEQYLAIQLEKVMKKDDILENYLNTINLGHNTLGVEAASRRYFNKPVTELTLSESATIAGITQNPTAYDPITNPEDNARRRREVLDAMLDQEYISEQEYKSALQDDVFSRIAILNAELASGTTSYFVDALCEQVVSDLVEEYGISETEAYSKLYSGGLTIQSTQDPRIQAICDEEINNQSNYGGTPLYSFAYRLTVQKPDGSVENFSEQTMLAYYKSGNSNYNINFQSEEVAMQAIEKYKSEVMSEGDVIPEGGESLTITLQPQTALSIVEQSTGHIPAIVGGRGEKTASRTLNRATNITRQPGSTFKIIAGYAPAIDAAGMSIASVIDDAPMTYDNGAPLRNYDGQYRGFTTIRTAIIHSINVVAVKTLKEIGTDLGWQYAQDLGISTIEPTDNIQSLVLGGLTYGVKNIDLTGAYACIANKGAYNRPVYYTTVTDYSGKVILDTTDDEPRQVLKEASAYLLTLAMKDVMTQGTGTPANFSGVAVAGKSGTTTSNRDTIFAGYTPYYTAAIWGGYDDNAVQGSTGYSKVIWRKVMSRIHEGLEYKDFERPSSGLTSATICLKSGKLAVPGLCDLDPRGSMVSTEYFLSGTAPTDSCDHHILVEVCTESNLPASPNCPEELKANRAFIKDGSPGTADSAYMVTDAFTESVCPIHTEGEAPSTTPGNVEVHVVPNSTPNGGGNTNNNQTPSGGGSPGGDSGNTSPPITVEPTDSPDVEQ